MAAAAILQRYLAVLHARPLATNMVSGVCLAAVGDIACQAIENDHTYAPRRTAELAVTRVILTPILLRWYGFLNGRFPGTAMRMVVSRMACDQLIWAPIFMFTFFPLLNMSRGMTLSESIKETGDRVGPALKTNYCLWPAFNVLNFRFVPLRFQVLATTCMATVWNGLLSHIARPKGEAKQQASEI